MYIIIYCRYVSVLHTVNDSLYIDTHLHLQVLLMNETRELPQREREIVEYKSQTSHHLSLILISCMLPDQCMMARYILYVFQIN